MKTIDLNKPHPEMSEEGKRTETLISELNSTPRRSERYKQLLGQLFPEGFGEHSMIHPPLYINLARNITIGNNVVIMPYLKAMSAGHIVIEDDVQIALNVSLLTNNHDPYERSILTIKDIHIKKGAWIGAGATILPGITIGKYAIVGAGSVVTKDVPDYTVVAGNPARKIRELDPKKFE